MVQSNQGIGIKGRAMALVWHEKVRCTALQASSVLHTQTLLVQTHNMPFQPPESNVYLIHIEQDIVVYLD